MKLYCSVTNTTNIISIQINSSHSAQTTTAQIEAINTSLDVGDAVTVDLGYVGNHGVVFTGFVKNLEVKEPTKTYSITCSDVLVRAMDFFIASSNPDEPYTKKNIKAENLVRDVLALASITNYVGDNTLFTFGIHNPVEVNLTSSYDYARFIADILAYIVYADVSGQVHFTRRLPYVTGSDTSVATYSTPDFISINRVLTDKDLRNRVVVYGADNIHAEASAASPHLPDGFYKTAVVAAPTVFDNQTMAQQSADYNLELLNRLTESSSVTMIGDHTIFPRTVVTVTHTPLGISGDWYVYSVTHTFGSGGFTTSLELRK